MKVKGELISENDINNVTMFSEMDPSLSVGQFII